MDILRRIRSGRHSFAPQDYSNSSDLLAKLEAFRPVVADIDALYEAHLITFPRKHRERFSGHRYVDHVMVERLTERGIDEVSANVSGAPPA
jgi:hypothetical protein